MVRPRDGHQKVVTVLEAYLDESGIHEGAEVCLIGGYFAGAGQWKKCEKLWERVLSEHDVPLEKFHAKDLVKCTGFFHGWSNGDSYSLQFALAETVAQYKIYPVAQGVVVTDFFKLSLSERRFMTGAVLTPEGKLVDSGSPNRPYFAPFQPVIKRVLSYVSVGAKGHFFFGLDRAFSQYATGLYATLKNNGFYPRQYQGRFGDIAFPLAKETPALQAADLMVHVVYQDMLEKLHENRLGSMAKPSDLIRLLLNNRRHTDDVVYQDEHLMRETLKEIPIEQRGELLREDLA
jgi:hypothetical protein